MHPDQPSAVTKHVRPDERQQALETLASLLKPGGRTYLTLRIEPSGPERDIYRISKETLRDRLVDMSHNRPRSWGGSQTCLDTAILVGLPLAYLQRTTRTPEIIPYANLPEEVIDAVFFTHAAFDPRGQAFVHARLDQIILFQNDITH